MNAKFGAAAYTRFHQRAPALELPDPSGDHITTAEHRRRHGRDEDVSGPSSKAHFRADGSLRQRRPEQDRGPGQLADHGAFLLSMLQHGGIENVFETRR